MSAPVASTRNEVIMAHIFCVTQQFCAVTVYVLGEKIMQHVLRSTFVFMRLMCVVPCVFLAAWLFTRKADAFKANLKTVAWMTLSGIVGITITQSLMFAGLQKSGATNTSIISAPCTPLFTALFSVLRGIDKMTIPKGIGFASSVAGALILLQVWNFKFEGTTFGNLLIVGSSLCSALNSLVQKHVLNQGYHPLVAQGYICLTGITAYTIGYAPLGLFNPADWVLSPRLWMYVMIVGIIATAVPWCIGIVALKHTSPMTTSVYVVLQPLIAVFVGIVLNGERLSIIQFLGSGLVLLGLVFVNATPIVTKLINLGKKTVMQSKEFELLPNEEKDVEMDAVVETDVIVSTDEVKYELSEDLETNAFVIDDEPDGAEDHHATPSIVNIVDSTDSFITYANKDSIPTATLRPILVA